ncbi:MAG: VOC family protein [Lachnospiraceae bacterium]|nr:VOC family protein [Lachnospiraceae bacterium]
MFHIDHTALSVSDMETSVAFYEKLGFILDKKWVAEDGSLSIVMLLKEGTWLELFCYQDKEELPQSAKEIATDLKVMGTKHFALHVNDLEEAIAYLLQNELISDRPEIKTGRLGRDYFFISDPDGILVEIISEK